ncbi:MAG: WecB/TagA/CpsF family glycosyltransferase [Pseudomonadota bacterium]
MHARAHVDGWPINVATPGEAVQAVMQRAKTPGPFTLFTLNLDHLVKLRHDDGFRAAYASADLITADGAPVAGLARRQDASFKRTTGADLVAPLCKAAARVSCPVFFFGSSPAVLAKSARALARHCDDELDVAGTLAPGADFDPTGPEADAALDEIRASGARLCFIALGAPKQELFAAYAVAKGVPCGFMCIGAGLDFIAGAQHRAPQAWQRFGMEWAWRLAGDPRRLAMRYARCARVLCDIVLRAPWRQVRTSRHPPASA